MWLNAVPFGFVSLLIATCGISGANVDRDSRRSSSGSTFPSHYRIEVDFVRMENKDGVLLNGRSCDTLSACDPKLYASVEPSSSETPEHLLANPQPWSLIFSATNNNSPTIGKTLQKDVCQVGDQGAVSQREAGARIVDDDGVTPDEDMGRYECHFSLRPSDVASSPASAQWAPEFECTAFRQVGKKIKLFARQRAYEISPSNCNAMHQNVVTTART